MKLAGTFSSWLLVGSSLLFVLVWSSGASAQQQEAAAPGPGPAITTTTQFLSGDGDGDDMELCAGCYSPADLDDPIVSRAAQFAVNRLCRWRRKCGPRGVRQPDGTVIATLEACDGYSFFSDMQCGSIRANRSTAMVVEASQAVVAGMKYDMKVVVEDELGECVGAFEVVVFQNLRGRFRIMEWGDELTCDEAMKLLVEEDNFF